MKMKSAWLVTWEWMGNHAAVDKKVVALINYRKPAKYVKDLVEQLYIVHTSSETEKAIYAKDAKANPYPARFATIHGVPWAGRMFCGHNPHLYARMVSNLRTEVIDGEDILKWDERPIPSLPEFN